jgi:hypothetical protein
MKPLLALLTLNLTAADSGQFHLKVQCGTPARYYLTDRAGKAWTPRDAIAYELAESEPSVEHGIRASRGIATHIHLYDPSRWPPGVRPESERMDWPLTARILREQNFHGSASVVVAPEGDPEPAARKSAAFLRNLFQGASA